HDAVAKIDQTRARIALDLAPRLFQRLQNENAAWFLNALSSAARQRKARLRSAIRFVERRLSARQEAFYRRRQRPPFFPHAIGERLHTDRIHQLKRPKLP